MSNKAKGREVVESAKDLLRMAKTVEELRQAQSVIFPLELGLSIEKTGHYIGISKSWVNQLRNRLIKNGGDLPDHQAKPGGRRRENMSKADEKDFLKPFFDKAKTGGILVVGEIAKALELRLGRKVALSSVYNLLHRHNWRKLAPDKHHPKVDPIAQEDFKKNSQT